MLRRRDNQQQQNPAEEEEEGFVESMFGSILTMPLPVPEILGTLEKTTFGNK